MPDNAPQIKQANVRGFGATIRFCAPTLAAREAACADVERATGATLVHPYDDARVIAGQGTAALELLEDVPDLDAIVAPVGGGGLLSGTAIAATASRPGILVLGAEPAGADDAARSFASGHVEPMPHPTTIADGLRSTLSPRTLQRAAHARRRDRRRAAKPRSCAAMRMTWERMKIVIEPSSRRAARVPARAHARRRGQARRRHPHRRQRRPRPPALAGMSAARAPVHAGTQHSRN